MLQNILAFFLVITVSLAANASPYNDTYSQILANYSAMTFCPKKTILSCSSATCKNSQPLKDVLFKLIQVKIVDNQSIGIQALMGYL